jgi:hypothetical protein
MHPPAICLVLLIALALPGRADVPIPGRILNPKTAAEAWNVIRLATTNVERLLDEKRLPEVPVQISYCSPSLRMLPVFLAEPEAMGRAQAEIKRAFISVTAIAVGAQQGNDVGARNALASLRGILRGVAKNFDPRAVDADIFVCPIHADFLSADAQATCPGCGRKLQKRRIPYSFIYMKPGEPTVRMTATASGPAEAGKPNAVKIRLEKPDGSPLTVGDLVETHGQPIHLLIVDTALSDYHREHPAQTKTPGEYTFSFTPKMTSPYRFWADIVPAATGIQELPFVDLASSGRPAPVEGRANRFNSSAGGYQFALRFTNGNHLPTRAGQARKMGIIVSDASGKPVTTLEPVMTAFAHVVGFYDDHATVLHLHPTSGDVLDPNLRGGPGLDFVLFAPKPGFIRLYCQVRIGGEMLFAPFNVNVEP